MYTRTVMTEIYLATANRSKSSSVSAEDYKDALSRLMKAMDELDNPKHMPNGLDPSIWEKFCLARRNKLESEQLVCKCFILPLYFSKYILLKISVEFKNNVRLVVKWIGSINKLHLIG